MAYQDTIVDGVSCIMENGTEIHFRNNEVTQYSIPAEGCKEIVYHRADETTEAFPFDFIKKVLEKKKADKDPDKKIILNPEEKGMEGKLPKEVDYKCDDPSPTMTYFDITEEEMFGFPRIPTTRLESPENGLWAFYGLRKFNFHFEHLEPMVKGLKSLAVNLVFDKRDNDAMNPITSEKEDVSIKVDSEADKVAKENGEYDVFVFVDTNKLGEKFDNEFAGKQRILFSGYIQLIFRYDTLKKNDVIYKFPLAIQVNNTNIEQCKQIQRNAVSIDFGTSSSCVAVRGESGVELITLSAKEDTTDEETKDINIYENPTCVMLYRWEEIYQQWQKENDDLPILEKGDLEDLENEKKSSGSSKKSVWYDFGYSVKQSLKEVNDRQLNAILTEIKMIPKYLDNGDQMQVRPLVEQKGGKKVVYLVDSYEKQDDENFDVIAFYGYILGKAINRVDRNKIYTRFHITYPVKFSKSLCDKVEASLRYGLQRSLPKPLRTAVKANGKPLFTVEMKYPEPVAYIGSVCGKELTYDTKKENPEGQLFAVFDFGGGTLDYSFGVFAQDEDDPNSSIIHVLGVDGDSNVGGELLIKRMAYWLYTSDENVKEFVKKKIPFEMPIGEVLPDACDEQLFDTSATAKSNVRKMSETFTRDIFQRAGISEEGNRTEKKVSKEPSSVPVQQVAPGAKKKTSVETEAVEEKGVNTMEEHVTTTVANQSKNTTSGSSSPEPIRLLDIHGKTTEIEVTVVEKVLTGNLKKLLKQKVEDFKAIMDRTFNSHIDVLKKCGVEEYDSTKVHIFTAGNSSRNQILQDEMSKTFEDNKYKIELVDEIKDKGKEKKIARTPKTAVAFGQVILSDYEVIDDYIHAATKGAPFNWYVMTINHGNNQASILVDKANATSEWKMYGKIKEDMKIYYSETPVEDADADELKTADIDFLDEDDMKKMLYVKVIDSDALECCVCEKGETPEESTVGQRVELRG